MKKSILFVLVMLGLCLSASPTQALLFGYNYTFSGTDPSGIAPWLTAEFEQTGANHVTLTLDTTGLVTGEFVAGTSQDKGWFFNFNPGKNVTALVFTYTSGNDANSIGQSANAFRAGGDGYYDIIFRWGTNTANRLRADSIVVYDIYMPGLLESDFDFESSPGPGGTPGPFLSAAHVQGISYGEGSGWVAPGNEANPVPEPATMLLLGFGLIGLAGFGSRKFFKKA